MSSDVDIVITWVDNNDPFWIEEINKYSNNAYDPRRYHNMDTLKYVFRGIEKNLNWIRKVYLVTCGHTPAWLNIANPKLELITHEQILPAQHLPTFNSAAIEMAFLNIPDLSEKFIYFNDDMFAISECKESDFFVKGIPVDSLKLRNVKYDGLFSHRLHNMMGTFHKEIENKKIHHFFKHLSKYINFRYSFVHNIQNIIFMILGTIDMIDFQHLPQPHLLSNWQYFHKKFPELARQTMSNRFRGFTDHNQYIFKFLSFAHGRFFPSRFNTSGYYHVSNPKELIESLSRDKENKTICINEDTNFDPAHYPELTKVIISFLETKLPTPSSFENVNGTN
jgi:hypothetical protein